VTAVYRSQRGILHRVTLGLRGEPVLHPRCRAGQPLRGSVLTDAEAIEWATGSEARLCRYRWCFREVLSAAGVDVEVGHVARHVSLGEPRAPRIPKHCAEQVEPVDGQRGWWWCSCDGIVIERRSLHNPDRRWLAHKATGYRLQPGVPR
jgi:hypothetical protein